MSTDPIRFLDDPSATMELREFMLGQDRPDALPVAQRRAVERRIAASVLALPLSMKVGGLLSQGTTSAGGGTAASSAIAGSTTGSAAAGSAAAGSGVAASGVAASGVWATGVATVAGGSVAPVAATGGALAKATLTLVGAKGTVGTLLGALSVTKGAAVLGMALATGVGASYVAKDVTSAPSATVSGPAAIDFARAGSGKAGSGKAGSGKAGSVTAGRSSVVLAGNAAESGVPASSSPTESGARAGSVANGSGESRAVLSLADLEAAGLTTSGSATSGSAATALGQAAHPSAAASTEHEYASERLQEEVELLRRAQQLLRTDRALAAETLERYDAKFPQGAMRAEYDVLRRRLLAMP